MTTTKKIPINEATADQLREYCEVFLGIHVSPNPGTKPETIKAKILQAKPDIEFIENEVEEEPAVPEGAAPQKVDGAKRGYGPGTSQFDPKVKIRINQSEGPGGNRGVPVGVNGQIMILPRGEVIEVPYRYYLALDQAVQATYHQDPKTHEPIASVGHSYPFQVIQMPPQEDIEAWHEGQEATQDAA